MQPPYKTDFINLALQCEGLKFDSEKGFTLKSGRNSPYFFNFAVFGDGNAMNKIGQVYSEAIKNAKFSYDVLFGPAYKGIPIVVATAMALSKTDSNVSYVFNRKQAKDHGEGGNLVGIPLKGKRVLILDDVITAGTALSESIDIIQKAGGIVAGIVVALDRQEKSGSDLSAIQFIKQKYNIPIASVITLHDLIEFLKTDSKFKAAQKAVELYQKTYGATAK